MEEEELILCCPHCNSELGIDESGDLFVIDLPELEANESRGISGLKVQHSGATPRDLALFNQQQNKIRESLTDVPFLGNDPRMLSKEAAAADQAITDANNKDLKKRAITPTKKAK